MAALNWSRLSMQPSMDRSSTNGRTPSWMRIFAPEGMPACLSRSKAASVLSTRWRRRERWPALCVAGFVDKLVHRLFDTFVDHHDDVADAVVVFECLDAPADDWLATHRHQLLGVVLSNRVPNPAASTTATTGIFSSCICSPLLICSTVKPRPHATPFRGGFCTRSATVATRIARIARIAWLV